MSIEHIITAAKEEVSKRAWQMKTSLCKELEDHAEAVKAQLENLANLQLPEDLLSAMLDQGAKVWASKVVGISQSDSLRIQNGSRLLFYETNESRAPSFSLARGAYKLVLLAFPQEVQPDEGGGFTDDYGQYVHIGDC